MKVLRAYMLFTVVIGVLMATCGCRGEQAVAPPTVFETFFERQDTSLVWFSAEGISADADTLLAVLRREAPACGLDTAAFLVPQIAERLTLLHEHGDSLELAEGNLLYETDSLLTEAYISYVTGQRYGFMRPERVFNRLDHKRKKGKVTEDFARLFDYEITASNREEVNAHVTADDRAAYLLTAEPQNPVYLMLKKRMATTTDTAERRRLAVNMERCRWQIKHPGNEERRIVVNIPSQQLWAICPDSILNMRICCGATTTKTPLLCSEISYMQVNPEWVIPQNIVDTDVARHGGDTAYFSRNDYFIIERSSGDTITAEDLTRDDLESGRYRMAQRGGAGNSLGRIVFRFPNNFSVYLHDTNNRRAFQRERRTLSHGCVRIEKPFEMACFLLPNADEWKLEKLRLSMDIKPTTERGKKYLKEHEEDERPLRLITYHDVTPHVPVFFLYYTVYPNPETGIVETWPDLYDYDTVIARHIPLTPFMRLPIK